MVLLTLGVNIRALNGLGDGLGNLLRSVLYGVTYDTSETLLWLTVFIITVGFTLWVTMRYV